MSFQRTTSRAGLALLATLAMSLLAGAGCKSDVEASCEHMAELAETADRSAPLMLQAADKFAETDQCIARMTAMKSTHPEIFAQEHECVGDAKTLEEGIGCVFGAAIDAERATREGR